MTRCTAYMATFCSCRFKRDTLGYRLRAWLRGIKQASPRIDLGNWPES